MNYELYKNRSPLSLMEGGERNIVIKEGVRGYSSPWALR